MHVTLDTTQKYFRASFFFAWKIAGRSLAPTTSAAQSVVLLQTNFYKAPIFSISRRLAFLRIFASSLKNLTSGLCLRETCTFWSNMSFLLLFAVSCASEDIPQQLRSKVFLSLFCKYLKTPVKIQNIHLLIR